MVKASSANSNYRVNVSGVSQNNPVSATNDQAKYWAELAKEYEQNAITYAELAKKWACYMDGVVEDELYSSKYYAEICKLTYDELKVLVEEEVSKAIETFTEFANEKEAEIEEMTNGFDERVETAKSGIDTYTNEKKDELDIYTTAKETQLDAFTLTKQDEITSATATQLNLITTEGRTQVAAVDNKGQEILSQLSDYAKKEELPTKTSDLTNDSGFISSYTETDPIYTADKPNIALKSELFSRNYNDLTNKPTIPTVPANVSAFNNDAGYLTEHQDISGKQDLLVSGTNIKTINDESILGEGNIEIKGGGDGAGMPIGTIFPLTCSSNYVPTGALPCDGTQYAKSQFSDLWTNYLVASLLNTCTYEEYASDIATYGQCGKFAIDLTNETFKVPTIKDGTYITQALSDSELGKAYNESLPNIKGQSNQFDGNSGWSGLDTSGAFYKTSAGKSGKVTSDSSASSFSWEIFGFDASLSSSTYQDGAKVQGDNIRLRYFVQVASGQINQADMDWSAWASSLQGKLNTTGVTNATSVDGQWVSKDYVVTTSPTGGSFSYDISSYLPNDNCTYEVMVQMHLSRNGYGAIYIRNSQMTPYDELTSKFGGNWENYSDLIVNTESSDLCNCKILPILSDRIIWVELPAATVSSCRVTLTGYRRLGTNE